MQDLPFAFLILRMNDCIFILHGEILLHSLTKKWLARHLRVKEHFKVRKYLEPCVIPILKSPLFIIQNMDIKALGPTSFHKLVELDSKQLKNDIPMTLIFE